MVFMFADDIKNFFIRNSEGYATLQNDLKSLYKWSFLWQLKFNASKCKHLQLAQFTIMVVTFLIDQ